MGNTVDLSTHPREGQRIVLTMVTRKKATGFPGEPELTDPCLLCDPAGHLLPASFGWSRHPLHTCNLRGHWPRKKKWNYWCVVSNKHLFSVTLSNIDYAGLAFAYFFDFATEEFIEQTVTLPLARGCVLPETVDADVVFKSRTMTLSFANDGRITHIAVDSSKFGGKTLSARLTVETPPGHESVNVVVPWSRRRFQFTSKMNCLPADGTVQLGSRTFSFQRETAFACLDFGRGIWPYRSTWNWASCSGTQNGRIIGLNLGGRWTDGTGMTENGACVDGKVTKFSEDVVFSYDPEDFRKPWYIRSRQSQRISLRFTPFYERVAKSNLLVLKSEAHQLFGRFSGTVVTDDGQTIAIDDLVGFAEEHKALW